MTISLWIDSISHAGGLDLIGRVLVHFLWQGTLIGAGAAAILKVATHATAATRYSISLLALLLMSAAPIATAVVLNGDAHHSTTLAANHEASVGRDVTAAGKLASPATLIDGARKGAAPSIALVSRAIALGWMSIVAILSVKLAGGWMLARRLVQRTMPAGADVAALADRVARRMGVRRAVRVLESAAATGPAVIGALTPILLLPAAALAGLAPAQIEALIAHELAHVRRHDYIVNLLQSVVETLLFYHPAVWWVSRQARIEREHCCDDVVIATCGDRQAYASALMALEYWRATPAMALAATDGSLVSRVQRILGVRSSNATRTPAWTSIAAPIAIAMALVPFAAASTTRAQTVPPSSVIQGVETVAPTGGVAGGIVSGVTNGVVQGVVGGTLSVVPNGAAAGVAADVSGKLKSAVASGVVAGTTGGVSGGVESRVVRGVSAGVAGVDARVVAGVLADVPSTAITAVDGTSTVPHSPDVAGTVASGIAGVVTTQAQSTQHLTPDEAAAHIGETATVCGVAAHYTSDELLTAHMGEAEVSNRSSQQPLIVLFSPATFSVAIPPALADDVRGKLGSTMCVTGRIQHSDHGDRINVTDVGQLAVEPSPGDASTILRTSADLLQSGAYRAGDPGVTMPVVVQHVDPKYTAAAMRQKIQGTVEVEAIVNTDGTVGKMRVVRSLDAQFGLDEEAKKALAMWRFTPASANGRPVTAIVRVELEFRLR